MPLGPELAGDDRRLPRPGGNTGAASGGVAALVAGGVRAARRAAPAPALTSTVYRRAPWSVWALRSWTSLVPPVHSGSPTTPGRALAESSWPAGAAQTHGPKAPSGGLEAELRTGQRRLVPAQREQVGRALQGDGEDARAEQSQGVFAQQTGGRRPPTGATRRDGERPGAERPGDASEHGEGASGGAQQAPARQHAMTHRPL